MRFDDAEIAGDCNYGRGRGLTLGLMLQDERGQILHARNAQKVCTATTWAVTAAFSAWCLGGEILPTQGPTCLFGTERQMVPFVPILSKTLVWGRKKYQKLNNYKRGRSRHAHPCVHAHHLISHDLTLVGMHVCERIEIWAR